MRKMNVYVALSMAALVACGAEPEPEITELDCEVIGEEIVGYFDECGASIPEGAEDEAEEFECTEESLVALECQAACIAEAPCEALDGSDLDAGASLFTCTLTC